MLRVVTLPYCRVAMLAPWDEPAHRRFVAIRCRDGFHHLLGRQVVDEFATLSSPVFLGPAALAGKLYDAGLSLAHRRDPELPVDLGWPPLVVGLEAPMPPLPPDWEAELLAAVARPASAEEVHGGDRRWRASVGEHAVERVDFGEATLWATDLPLLPKQLGLLCEVARRPFALAVGVAQSLERRPDGTPQTVVTVGEARLRELLAAAGEMGP